MGKYEAGDILTGKRLGKDIRLISHLHVDGVKRWVFQKGFEGSGFKGGDVGVINEEHLDAQYSGATFEDGLTEGELWLAEDVDGRTQAFVARSVRVVGVRLWNVADVTWSSYKGWTGISGYTNFRRPERANGEYL